MTKSKFDELKRDDLLRLCLEQESELEQLRPKPAKFKLAKFKLGQLVALMTKNPWMQGQPAIFFVVLSVQHQAGEWHYGYARSGPHNFHVHAERKCRALTPTELDGTQAPTSTTAPNEAQSTPDASAHGLTGLIAGYGGFAQGEQHVIDDWPNPPIAPPEEF